MPPQPPSFPSVSGREVGKLEEMEKMLKEAHAEKSRLMESRVRQIWTRSPRRGGGSQHRRPLPRARAFSRVTPMILAKFP